jgi:sulfoxide reductase heme-binding subunit YedZ
VKATAFGGVLLPALQLLGRTLLQDLGAEPYTEVIHQLGLWTIRLLLITLAVTPLQQILGWRGLGSVRRILGVATGCYAALHLGGYMLDQMFDWTKIATEILLRLYLLIGFVALLGLLALTLTSTDGMMRRLGRNWGRLHRLVYPVALLGLAHFFIQSKLDITEPTWMAGLFALLLGWRLLPRLLGRTAAARPAVLLLLALVVAGITSLAEALYFHLLTGVPVGLVLGADLDLAMGIRPPQLVLAAGLALALAAGLQRWLPRLRGLRLAASVPR